MLWWDWAFSSSIAAGKFLRPILLIVLSVGASVGWGWYCWPPTPVAPSVILAAVKPALGCEPQLNPVPIEAGSQIHVLRLAPHYLAPQKTGWEIGQFDDISSGLKERAWPSQNIDGRWYTNSENDQDYNEWKAVRVFMLARCVLSNPSNSPIDTITVPLTIQPNISNTTLHRTFQISFDPLGANQNFQFYVANYCSDPQGIYLTWGNTAELHVLGESKSRSVDLALIRRGWPGYFMVFEPSAFKWQDGVKCNWKWQ